jgi:hypothetical protein
MSNTYPTWTALSHSYYATEEQRDGVPDKIMVREGKQWWVKWRTSAHWSGPYADRKTAIEQNRR